MCLYVDRKGSDWIRSMDEVVEVWKRFSSRRPFERWYVHTIFQQSLLERGKWISAERDWRSTQNLKHGGFFHAYRSRQHAEDNARFARDLVIPCFMYTRHAWWGLDGDICAPKIFICTAAQSRDPDFAPPMDFVERETEV
jgi:hypothetical protein